MGQASGRGRPGRSGILTVAADAPLVGWRYWQVSATGRLRSVTKKWIEWVPGQAMHSVCLEVGHASPANDCNCGVYGIAELDQLRQHGLCLVPHVAIVVGQVALWGRVIDDNTADKAGAWRGEHGRPAALWLVEGTLPEPALASTVDRLGDYGVPVATMALDDAVAGVSAAVLGFQAMSAQTNRWATADPDA